MYESDAARSIGEQIAGDLGRDFRRVLREREPELSDSELDARVATLTDVEWDEIFERIIRDASKRSDELFKSVLRKREPGLSDSELDVRFSSLTDEEWNEIYSEICREKGG